jgi:hypothetical protein
VVKELNVNEPCMGGGTHFSRMDGKFSTFEERKKGVNLRTTQLGYPANEG